MAQDQDFEESLWNEDFYSSPAVITQLSSSNHIFNLKNSVNIPHSLLMQLIPPIDGDGPEPTLSKLESAPLLSRTLMMRISPSLKALELILNERKPNLPEVIAEEEEDEPVELQSHSGGPRDPKESKMSRLLQPAGLLENTEQSPHSQKREKTNHMLAIDEELESKSAESMIFSESGNDDLSLRESEERSSVKDEPDVKEVSDLKPMNTIRHNSGARPNLELPLPQKHGSKDGKNSKKPLTDSNYSASATPAPPSTVYKSMLDFDEVPALKSPPDLKSSIESKPKPKLSAGRSSITNPSLLSPKYSSLLESPPLTNGESSASHRMSKIMENPKSIQNSKSMEKSVNSPLPRVPDTPKDLESAKPQTMPKKATRSSTFGDLSAISQTDRRSKRFSFRGLFKSKLKMQIAPTMDLVEELSPSEPVKLSSRSRSTPNFGSFGSELTKTKTSESRKSFFLKKKSDSEDPTPLAPAPKSSTGPKKTLPELPSYPDSPAVADAFPLPGAESLYLSYDDVESTDGPRTPSTGILKQSTIREVEDSDIASTSDVGADLYGRNGRNETYGRIEALLGQVPAVDQATALGDSPNITTEDLVSLELFNLTLNMKSPELFGSPFSVRYVLEDLDSSSGSGKLLVPEPLDITELSDITEPLNVTEDARSVDSRRKTKSMLNVPMLKPPKPSPLVNEQLVGEALFPKTLNTHELESITSLERSISMRSIRSVGKRSSFLNYNGSDENIVLGSEYTTDLPVRRSGSILKNSTSNRSLALVAQRGPNVSMDGYKLIDSALKVDKRPTDQHIQHPVEDHKSRRLSTVSADENFSSLIEFKDFIDYDTLQFSPVPSIDFTELDELPEPSHYLTVENRTMEIPTVILEDTSEIQLYEVSEKFESQSPEPEVIIINSYSSFEIEDSREKTPEVELRRSREVAGSLLKTPEVRSRERTPEVRSAERTPEDEPRRSREVERTPEVAQPQVKTPEVASRKVIGALQKSPLRASTSDQDSINSQNEFTNSGGADLNRMGISQAKSTESPHLTPRPFSMSFKGFNGSGSGRKGLSYSFDESNENSAVGQGFGISDEEEDESEDDYSYRPPRAVGTSDGGAKNTHQLANSPQSSSERRQRHLKRVLELQPPLPFHHDHVPSISDNSAQSSPRLISSLVSRMRKLPQKSPVGVRFSSRIILYDTYHPDDYDRHPDVATCNQLTPQLAQQIKAELNELKSGMDVHEESRHYTHFF